MKNSFFLLMLFATLFVGCKINTEELIPQEVVVTEDADVIQSRSIRCPRADFDINGVGISDMRDFAVELTAVANCGGIIRLPDCDENDFFTDEATVFLDEWCDTTNSACACNRTPSSFSIAEQDAYIAQAKALLATELSICGLDNASYNFFLTETGVADCKEIVLKLFAEASALCCHNTF